MSDFTVIYTTLPTIEAARQLAHHLLNNKLAACVNVVPGITSYYIWEGSMQEDAEVQLWCKTSAHLQAQVIESIASNHPYDCPAILAFPLLAVHAPFAEWIREKVG